MMLQVSNLLIARGGVPVLDGVEFSLDAGEALVLRGRNGIGKTTLLRTIAGLQKPLSGDVSVDPDHIAYAAHSDGIKTQLTVEENLMFWAQVFGTSDIEPALNAFDMAALRDRLGGNLSAGQKRRLGLSRLLVTGRPIWILDEPTVSLDAASVQMFADAVRAHLSSGGAALLATHIDLGLEARVLDLTPFQARDMVHSDFDEAFL